MVEHPSMVELLGPKGHPTSGETAVAKALVEVEPGDEALLFMEGMEGEPSMEVLTVDRRPGVVEILFAGDGDSRARAFVTRAGFVYFTDYDRNPFTTGAAFDAVDDAEIWIAGERVV